jgi:hypothetical protein
VARDWRDVYNGLGSARYSYLSCSERLRDGKDWTEQDVHPAKSRSRCDNEIKIGRTNAGVEKGGLVDVADRPWPRDRLAKRLSVGSYAGLSC